MRLINYLAQKIGDLTIKYSNLPESYIERSYKQIYYRSPRGLKEYQSKTIQRKKYHFGTARPWTAQFREQNVPGTTKKKIFLEPVGEWKFFLGDRVEVMVGRDKGKQGLVSQVIQERNWVIVEGLNTTLKRLGKEKDYPGVIMRWEAPLLVTGQVKLVDPETMKPTDVDWRFTEDGEKVRISTETSRIIPIPKLAEQTYDYKTKATYDENVDKDTVSDVASKITFVPELKTFEMDIMDKMGIKEDRIPELTYWY